MIDSVLIKQLCKALGLIHCILYSTCSTSNPDTQQLAMRMAALGDWQAFSERFEQYMIANEIEDKKKVVAMFLTMIGSKTYNVLRDLLAPAELSEVKFQELVKTLKDHYEPKAIMIAKQFHFHKCKQHEGEGVAVYSAAP